MKKGKHLLHLFLWFAPFIGLAQDTVTVCRCYKIGDTSLLQPVPFTMGIDSVSAPYYYNNVNTSQAIKLPFSFCFYGKSYDTVYIGNKGNITFHKPIFNFTSGNFPAGKDTMMIAPFWANECNIPFGPHPAGVGEVWYKIYPNYLVVYWDQVQYQAFDCDLYDNFKVIISNGSDPVIPGGNNVSFCYDLMQWASGDSSGGSAGFGGIPATVGINKGDDSSYAVISRFSLPGYSFGGPSSPSNGLYWLTNKSFIMNTCVTEKNIAPVILNPDKCDTIQMCPYDSAHYTMYFLCSEPNQKTTLSASSLTMAGISLDTVSKANKIYTASLNIYASPTDVGTHVINVTATDNSTPAQKSTYPVVVIVDACTGINEVGNKEAITVYPNSSHGTFTLDLSGQFQPNTYIRVYNMIGQEVYTSELKDARTTINLEGQTKGMYLLKVYHENNELGAKKLVIE